MKCSHGGCQTDAEFMATTIDIGGSQTSFSAHTVDEPRPACRFHLHNLITDDEDDYGSYASLVERIDAVA